MYLKKIEILGFKTFAEKSVIEFPQGANITAIVGPNGCGKSNFLEAVKWGLGEQSLKALRVSSPLEIIFAGSKKKSALSLAEVQITIDNSSFVLDLDYQEIAVKRRLYRSLESEFFLNKGSCRLKDIHDLFIDTGVGKNSYSIIGQGQIDLLINMKPEDKKKMFEESAGINKYKDRKHSSQLKLTRTEQDLQRIVDLQSELDNQIKELEIQAKTAIKYLELKENLKNIELSILKEKMQTLAINIQDLNKNLKLKQDEILNISNQNLNNENLKQRNKQELSLLENQLAENIAKKELAKNNLEEIKSFILISEERTKNQNEAFENITKEKEKIQNELLEQENILLDTKNDLSEKEFFLADLQAVLMKIEEKQRQDKKELENLAKTETNILVKINQYQSKLTIIEEMQRNYEGYFQGVKSILEAKNRHNKFSGVFGIVADFLESNSEIETAIEVALGNHLQDIITDNEATAKLAISYLRENGLGRASFLPLKLIKEQKNKAKASYTKQDGILGVASDLVSCKDINFIDIIEMLLGNILIVDNIDTGIKVVKDSKNYQGISRIVTLKGEILMFSGMMTGGSLNKRNVPILGRQRMILELGQELEKLDIEFDKIKQAKINLLEKTETISEKIVMQKIELEKQTGLFKQIEVKKQAVEFAINDNKQKLAKKELDFSQISNSLNKIKADLKEKQTNLPKLEKELLAVQETIGKINNQQEKLKNNIDELDNQVQYIFKLNQSLRDELSVLELRKSKLDSEKQRIQEDLAQKYNMFLEELLAYQIKEISFKKSDLTKLYEAIKELEPVNLLAIDEYQKKIEKDKFLKEQVEDLLSAKESLIKLISELDKVAILELRNTLLKIENNFQDTFERLFEGGKAYIKILDEKNILSSGIDIFVELPKKKPQSMSLLSGGEKALTAVALIFALMKTRPAPFCVLDEVDAALDETNIAKFAEMLKTIALDSQVIIISHNKQTLTAADNIYGITMEEPGISKLISIKNNYQN